MRKIMGKVKLYFIKSFCYEGVRGTISFFISLIICLIVFLSHTKKFDELFDVGVFFAIIGAFVLNFIAYLIYNIIANKIEDSQKLTTDYDNLVKTYCASELLTYINEKDSDVLYEFPVSVHGYLNGKKIEIEDSQEMYQLPPVIKENYDFLLSAHDTSTTYNQLNIRVNDWVIQDDKFTLITSRTTYFNSLVTNRAMDYRMKNGCSVRDFFCYGPFAPELKSSQLSNHLGFNCFVESRDGYIPFIQRGKHLSVGKNTLGTSVSASLKTKYALSKDKNFSIKGLEEAIKNEIEDELKIKREELEKDELLNCIVSSYQDLVEGGKPQLLLYMKSTLDLKEIEDRFNDKTKMYGEKNSYITYKESKSIEDGNSLIWIDKNDLKNSFITPGYIVCSGKKYKMLPSASASIVMILKSGKLHEIQ